MSSVRVSHDIGGLERDLATIARRVGPDMRATVRRATIAGNDVARSNARRTAGAHGKLYPKAFSWDTGSAHGFGGAAYIGEYGPDAARPQGNMSFEGGSRNQRPHNDLAKSADLMGPALAGEVRRLPDKWFWPGNDR